ncbi:MAG: DNA polymerase III subunit epsilon, partial [Bacteroidota bacterium]
ELIALLLESEEIKRLEPNINRAQRAVRFSYALYSYHNEAGYRCFDVTRNTAQARKELDILSEYPTLTRAKRRLDHMRKRLQLCSSLTNLFPSRSACFHYHLKQCLGACVAQETVAEYNDRADQAYEYLRTVFDEDFLLVDQGRTSEERAIVLVQDGKYRGFGFVSEEVPLDLPTVEREITFYAAYPDTARIIQRFMSEHPAVKVLPL